MHRTCQGCCFARPLFSLKRLSKTTMSNCVVSVRCVTTPQANHLLPPLKQTAPAEGSAAADSGAGAASGVAAAADVGVNEDELARCVGYFLRTCPGLSKVTIGELLGDPDKFYLKVCCVCWGGGLYNCSCADSV
jgi:hypothetical protein